MTYFSTKVFEKVELQSQPANATLRNVYTKWNKLVVSRSFVTISEVNLEDFLHSL